jgi:hypothetical protein
MGLVFTLFAVFAVQLYYIILQYTVPYITPLVFKILLFSFDGSILKGRIINEAVVSFEGQDKG